MTTQVYDDTALRLESAGLWRRAAARWLYVMLRRDLTDAQREWICLRRRACQAQLTATP